jgi:hypothetical protein
MADYTVIDAFGTPKRYGTCPDDLVDEQAEDGESVVDGLPPSAGHVWNGSTWVERPPKPTLNDEWIDGSWVDPRTLPDAQAEAWERVKAAQQAAIIEAGTTSIQTLDTSEQSLNRITSVATMLLAAPGISTVNFTCADNVRRTFSRADFITMALEVGQAVQATYDVADELRQDIAATVTIAEADAISWPA